MFPQVCCALIGCIMASALLEPVPCAFFADQIDWNSLQVFHESESRAEIDAVATEQALIQQNEVGGAVTQEF